MDTGPTDGASTYYQELVESAPDAFVVVNQGGTIEIVNRQAELLFGYSREELVGQPIDLLVPERAKGVHPSHRASYFSDPRTRPMGAGLKLTARRKDGTEVPVDISLSPVQTADGLVVSVAIRDVTERQRSESALQDAYRQLSASVRDLERHDREMTLINEMGDLLQACLTAGEANEVISRYGQHLFPRAAGTVFTTALSTSAFEAAASWGITDDDVLWVSREECWALRRARIYTVEGGESRAGPTCAHVGLSAPHGYVCVPMLAQGEAIGLLHVHGVQPVEDGYTVQQLGNLAVAVAEHLSLALANLSLRESLRHQSLSDPLTGLYNRRYLQDRLVREIHRAGRGARSVGIVVADIDHFKDVNDRLGHSAGDEVLRSVARILESGVRSEDTVCRYGGDEFVLVLPDSPLPVAVLRAEHLREAVSRLGRTVGESALPITLSLGVAVFPDDGSTADDVLRAADTAMYRAKAQGRDQVASAPT